LNTFIIAFCGKRKASTVYHFKKIKAISKKNISGKSTLIFLLFLPVVELAK
jgi:hypothetical protein